MLVDFNYEPILGNHYDSIQRISLYIGVNAFRNKCKKIALIDADEFIYIPNMKIETFLLNYDKKTIQICSYILTNKNNDDLINNNILNLSIYLANINPDSDILINKKIDTSLIKENEFIISPHGYPNQITVDKSLLVFYHCYINKR